MEGGEVVRAQEKHRDTGRGVVVDAGVPKLYTVAQAADLLQVGRTWIYDGIATGEIQVTDLARTSDANSRRHKFRISSDELHRLIKARTA